LDKLQENFNSYNIAGAIEFDGKVNADILQKTLDILIFRHEILRTNFITILSNPRQVIQKRPRDEVFENIEVENTQEYIEQEAKKVFDLECDSLFYIKLINSNILFLNMHHIISDGWSIGIILDELSQIYTALLREEEIEKEPLGIQYKEYAHWQNGLLEDESTLVKHKEYWHSLLENPTTLNFPLDHSRPKQQTFAGDAQYFIIDNRLTSKLLDIAKDNTLFITLLTISNILLAKYSNQDDIIIGTPVANRENEILARQIGFYVNTLALRSRIDREKSFEENLLSTKDMCLDAFAYQDYPFDKLVDELNLDRDLTQNPLFNTMVILQNNEMGEIKFDTLKSTAKRIDTKTSKLDMTLNYTQINSDIELMVEYNTDLFEHETIQRLFENLETLIDSIELDKTINELAFISNNQQVLLDSFNNSKREYPIDETIIELFETKVSEYPDNIAISFEDKEISYHELNKEANQIGHHLIDKYNVTKEMIIPIILDKSPAMISSLLGVLKSGGAYLPIDSDYPKDRVLYMLKDSNAKLLITDRANMSRIGEYCSDLDIDIVCVEDIKSSKINNPNIERSSTDLAYIIYTSGTTGNPKGVMVEHKSFINMILYQIEGFGILESDRVIQFASFSFDASIYETFLTLLAGACYVIVDKETLLNRFVEISQKYSVNTAVLNPTFLANIGELEGFKTIITAGEKAIVSDALKYASKCNYINAYGPTETSICSAFYKVDKDKTYNSIPIGRSIANISNYILNDTLEQMPIGTIGEICTSGIGLARGYLNREDLTNEKFINHPQYGRIYQTGDMGRCDENGDIEYLGRVDNQVKLRGFRIELGEIENTILKYSSIKECVVIVFHDKLLAYIVGEEKELKSYLREILADYMIPSFIITLETLPLTPNGKIDTKSLPIPEIK
ncbi:amino acid adenylation domain-containing protein, partial [Sulfurovum sp. bin170]|uniref:non-ribosomal peptide synthetase n=1 Tax=Sulfurovum sp. bin170 TaxID=2695268 RepID=UPI0013DF4D34